MLPNGSVRQEAPEAAQPLLNEIDAITPWEERWQVNGAHCLTGEHGRPPKGLERLLRMDAAQQCPGLSDEGSEDAIDDSDAVRRFVGVDPGADAVPAAAELLTARRLLQKHTIWGVRSSRRSMRTASERGPTMPMRAIQALASEQKPGQTGDLARGHAAG